MRAAFAAVVGALLMLGAKPVGPEPAGRGPEVVIGSKNFTESRLLGEILALLVEEHAGVEAVHRTGLGGTLVCHQALVSGELDLYPEYSGTAWATILEEREPVTDPLRAFLHVDRTYRERYGVEWSQPLGFENTYALAVDAAVAERLGIRRLSDLAAHADELTAGLRLWRTAPRTLSSSSTARTATRG